MKSQCLLVAAVIAMAAGARADVIHVPDDFDTIQDAIEAAADGDTVMIRPGTYHENLLIEFKTISIVGEAGAGETIVMAADAQKPVLTLFVSEGDEHAMIQGLHLTGGRGGLEVSFAEVVIDSCVIDDNPDGSGMSLFSSTVTVIDCNIARNGGSNIAGGGMYCDLSFLDLYDTTIEENRGSLGGGLRLLETNINIVGCEFTANEAEDGGALYTGLVTLSIADTNFTQNIALNNGGAMNLEDAFGTTVDLVRCGVRGNQAIDGGGILVGATALLSVSQSAFCGNATEHIVGEWDDLGENTFADACREFGDLNNDGQINVADLLMLLAAWGACRPEGECAADLNGDGNVDTLDMLIMLDKWSE